MRSLPIALIWLLALVATANAAPDLIKVKLLLKEANAASEAGDKDKAMKLANEAVTADSVEPEAYYVRGRLYDEKRDFEKAVSDYTEVLKLASNASGVYQRRGEALFKLGRFKECILDFDKFIELVPGQEPHHWQRGIAYYYAKRYEDGRKQFELHQKVNQHDVENAVWHFICVARLEGPEKARASLIKITGDTRVPMAQVHAMFAGKATASDVLEAARAGRPGPGELSVRLFFANLYLGLYYEAIGEAKTAKEHIFKARSYSLGGGYMWEVARVHAELLEKAEKK